MDAEELLGVFMRSVLGHSGRKRARNAASFLGGNKGFLTASTLLAGVGLAWGIYDSMKGRETGAPPPPVGGFPEVVPPVPGAARDLSAEAPLGAATDVSAETPFGAKADEVLRIIRLAVSAARADGTLSAAERALILGHAHDAGFESVVEQELASPYPLAAIVAGVTEVPRRHDLYVLAFTIVRADEGVTGAERIYLAQLAHQLGLDAATVLRLETETAGRIDSQANAEGTTQNAEGTMQNAEGTMQNARGEMQKAEG